MNLYCIIIDDEPLAREKLQQYVSKVPMLKMIGSFEDAVDALMFLKTNEVQLIFLDIQMENLNGIQFMEALNNPPKIIITSAYSEYAIQGFEFRVSDYLLKPIPLNRFLKAVDKVTDELKVNSKTASFIFVKTEYRMERVGLEEILYIEGMKDYLRIVTANRSIMTLQSFASIEKSLNSNFLRVHKSYIVALDKIKSIERNVIHIADRQVNIGIS
ncbi:MAG: response regulator transcription factor, partial [Proteobacteria bacterium]